MMNFKLKTNEYDSLKQYFWLIPLITLLAYSINIAIHKPIGDFGNYYYGSKFLAEGNWGTWIYEPAKFNLAIYDLGERNFFLNYTPVPPFSSIIYLPFTLFNASDAKLIWNILNSLLFIFTIYRLQKTHTVHYLFWCLIPVFFFTPIRNTITEGQSYFLILFLLVEGYLQYSKGRVWLMALLWALSIHLKISPAIVLLFLLFNKDFKASVQLIVASILVLIISIPILSSDV